MITLTLTCSWCRTCGYCDAGLPMACTCGVCLCDTPCGHPRCGDPAAADDCCPMEMP